MVLKAEHNMACLFLPACYTPGHMIEEWEGLIIPMKIGVLSDTHLSKVSANFRDICDRYFSDVDVIFHAGDFTSGNIVAFLSEKTFYGVSGNMDPVEVKAVLPDKRVIELGGYKFGLIHGWGSSKGLEERVRPEFQDVDVIVYGHSHRAANHIRDGILFFNPGTATGFSSSETHSIGFLECADKIKGSIVDLD